MAGQFLGRGFRCVTAQPGQRHLVAVDGLRFGPDHRCQGAPEAGAAAAPQAPRARTALHRTALHRIARSRMGTGMYRTAAVRTRRQAAAPRFRCRRRGRTPAAAARCRRQPTAVPCRRRPRQRRRGAGCHCSPEPKPARQRSKAGVRRTARHWSGWHCSGRHWALRKRTEPVWRGRMPEPGALPGRSQRPLRWVRLQGFPPVPAALPPGLSARSQSARWRGSRHRPKGRPRCPPSRPLNGPASRCQVGFQRPTTARFRPSAAARACSEKGGSAGSGGRFGIRTTPRLTTTRARHTRSA